MADIDFLLEALIELDGSDLHLSEGSQPKVRIHGKLMPLDEPVLDHETMERYMEGIVSPDRWKAFRACNDLDFAYAIEGQGRFRSNFFRQEHGYGAVFRLIPSKVLTLDDLKLPDTLRDIGDMRSGLCLVTGPTGSGKSTTMAAIIDYINSNYARHILTIEEPIEFVHANKKSIFCQREVGMDVKSFAAGLKAGLRQDLDVILVGEMRDRETIQLAVTAAATGTLVFGTLHTQSAIKTVNRIVDVFPHDQQEQIRGMLADSLKAIVAQLLMRKADESGRIPALEILLGTPALSSGIRGNNNSAITNVIQGGGDQGMVMMDDAIEALLKKRVITGETAYMKSIDKARFATWAPIKG